MTDRAHSGHVHQQVRVPSDTYRDCPDCIAREQTVTDLLAALEDLVRQIHAEVYAGTVMSEHPGERQPNFISTEQARAAIEKERKKTWQK